MDLKEVLGDFAGKTFIDNHGYYFEISENLITIGARIEGKNIPLFRSEIESLKEDG